MQPLSIVKFYAVIDTLCKLLLRFVLCAIDFFPLHEREKRLRDGVVIGWPGAEKDWTTLFMRNSLRKVLEVYCVPWPLWSIKDCGAFCFDTLAGMLM